MSDTPRTDKASHYVVKVGEVVQALFSRQLERELNAAKASHAADVAELNERLTKQQADMLDTIVGLRSELASADREIERLRLMVQMMDESEELTRWQALAGQMAASLKATVWRSGLGNAGFRHLTEENAETALSALASYESAKKGEQP